LETAAAADLGLASGWRVTASPAVDRGHRRSIDVTGAGGSRLEASAAADLGLASE